ncbi:MAG TPA: hypothetical protein VFV50_06680 [Bdellovibrionales bacterium]|nr:hypothetical protein [Bdellovibrionales bacterium]
MSRFFVVLIALTMSAKSWGALPKTWKEIETNAKYKKTLDIQQVQRQAVAASGDIQTFVLADRFVFLFDQTGVPIVAFDLTLEPTGWKEMAMGAIGIGAWSFKNFMGKYKAIKENPEAVLRAGPLAEGALPQASGLEAQETADLHAEMDQTGSQHVPNWSDQDIAKGYKEFAKLKFNDEWIKSQGQFQALADGKDSGFKPASFTMADLKLNEKQQGALHKVMNEFSKVHFGTALDAKELPAFMSQFQMKWSEEKKEFAVLWSPEAYASRARNAPKQPELPGWLLNYGAPYDILGYKYSLQNVERMAAGLDSIIPTLYADIVGIMVSRVTNGLKSRLDGHENQLQALFEGALRGDYEIKIPLLQKEEFLKISVLMLYLNKMIDTDDVTDPVAKMKHVLNAEAKHRAENLALLAKKNFLTQHPSMHYYDNAPWMKTFGRVGMEVLVDAVRLYMPTQLNFGKWLSSWFNINLGIYMPGAAWDMIFRTRYFAEMAYEGQVISLMNETMKGRYKAIPGYDVVELHRIVGHMTGARANAFEIAMKFEADAMTKNMQLIKNLIGGQTQSTLKYMKQ